MTEDGSRAALTAAEIQQAIAALRTIAAGIGTAATSLQAARSSIDSVLSGLGTVQSVVAIGLRALEAEPALQSGEQTPVNIPPDTWSKQMQG